MTAGIVLCSWERHSLLSQCLSPPRCITIGDCNLLLRGNPVINQLLLRGGDRNTPTRFMLQKLKMSTSVINHLACQQNMDIYKFTYLRRYCSGRHLIINQKELSECLQNTVAKTLNRTQVSGEKLHVNKQI